MGNLFQKNGMVKYHINGRLYIQENYKNGELEGERKEWYRNGRLEIQCYYKNGFREGERKTWLENGQLFMQEFYKNGKLEGEITLFSTEGTLKKQTFWLEGKNVSKKEYYYGILSLLDDRLDELHLKDIIFSFL